MDSFLLGLSVVAVLSVAARLLGNLLRIPVIVPLLIVGVLVGNSVTGLVDPQELLGEAFIPFVKISVAIILFEGALRLRTEDLEPGIRPAVIRLITLGVVITWALAAVAVALILGLPEPISVLIGAIVIVSGPTVVLPLLDFIEPPARVRSVLKWEGILIDPVGGIIAVVIFGSLVVDGGSAAFDVPELILSIGTGLIVGLAFAALLMPILSTHRIGARDKVAATLMMVIAAFAVSDAFFEDSGLVATIVMGLVLANQRRVNITYINEFKETLVPILIGVLFVLLAANVKMSEVVELGLPGIALVLALTLLVRPLTVLTTIGLPFSWKERLLMATMSPRGIVAASTASAFGLVLAEKGIDGAEKVIPVTFLVIAGSVLFASIAAPLAARLTGLTGKSPPGLLMVGAPQWAIALARAMSEAGVETWAWTGDRDEADAARSAGINVIEGPLDLHGQESISLLDGLSAVLLVSDDDSVNELLGSSVAAVLEPDQVFRLEPRDDRTPMVRAAGRVVSRGVFGLGAVEEALGDGDRFEVFDPESVPEGAVVAATVTPAHGVAGARIEFGRPVAVSHRHRASEKVVALIAGVSD